MAIMSVDARGIGSLTMGAPASLSDLPWNRTAAPVASSIGRQRAPVAIAPAVRATVSAAPVARATAPMIAPSTSLVGRGALAVQRPGASSSMPSAGASVPVAPSPASAPIYSPSPSPAPSSGPSYSMPASPSPSSPVVAPSYSMPSASPSSPSSPSYSMPSEAPRSVEADPGTPELTKGAAPDAATPGAVSPTMIYVGGGVLALLAGLGIYLAVR